MRATFKSIAFLSVILLASLSCFSQQLNIIPYPRLVQASKGSDVVLPSEITIVNKFKTDISSQVQLAESMFNSFGVNVVVDDKKAMKLLLEPCDTMQSEAYGLEVGAKRITIKAANGVGVLYALQTLHQYIFNNSTSSEQGMFVLRPIKIYDAPAFSYRGMLLDVSRHFFTVDQVKTVMDIMAMHKLNTLHLHLVDDQGWRIEIKAYPELTRVGSVRRESMCSKMPLYPGFEILYDNQPYGGYYTQDDCRELVRYGKQLGITIIPEIEIPGHSTAALASYPWLGCTGKGYEVLTRWGVSEDLVCPGKSTSWDFWHQVLKETAEIFPSQYIHIGGDECPKSKWKQCHDCQQFIKDHNLANEAALQGYVSREIEKYLASMGRKMIGWGELLDYDVSPTTTVMLWQPDQTVERALKGGNHVVISTKTFCYYNYYQSQNLATEPLAIGGDLPFDKAYSLEPLKGLTDEEKKYVTGVQANLWSEYIEGLDVLEYMALPRLACISEIGWYNGPKDLPAFKQRAIKLIDIYKSRGYKVAPHIVLEKQ